MPERSIVELARSWAVSLFKLKVSEVRLELEEVQAKGIIPEEYSQRFEIAPLQDSGQLAGREQEMSAINQAWINWATTNNPLLVIGEAGSGMASLLNSSCVHFPHAYTLTSKSPVRSHQDLVNSLAQAFRIDPVTKLEEIRRYIEEEEFEKPPVIILENVERLFRRKVNGFHLLEEFLLFIHATKDKVFWITSINTYAAHYLNQVLDLSANFPSKLHIPPLSKEYIEQLLHERNDGYEWFFLRPENGSKAFYKKLAKADANQKQEILKTHFFKSLHETSEGNISIALLFITGSIWHVNDKKVLMRAFNPKPITDLSKEDLFLAEAILQHYSITARDLKQVLHDVSRSASLNLEKLLERSLIRLISPADGPAYFRIDLLHLHRLKFAFRNRLNRKL